MQYTKSRRSVCVDAEFGFLIVCLICERIAEQTNFIQNVSRNKLTGHKIDDQTSEL